MANKKRSNQTAAPLTLDQLIAGGYKYKAFESEAPASQPEASKSRGLLDFANDTVIEVANAAAGGLSSAANFIKPGNAVSGWIDKNIVEAGEASQSDVVKASKQKFRDGVAQADGVMGELGAVGGYIADAPLLAAAQAVGSFVVPGAAIKGAGLAGRAAGLGAKGVQNSGRAGGVAAGAALAGGDAAGTAYELSTKAGAAEDEAVAAARGASVIPALVGAAGGAFGAESLLAGAKGFGGGMVARAAKTGLSEAAQEAVEEGVTQYEGQRAAMPFDASIDPSKGVAAAAGMGAAMGGITGAGTSLLVGDRGREAPNALEAGIAAGAGGPTPTSPVDQAQAALASMPAGNATPEQRALLKQLQADQTGANNVSPVLDMDALQRQGITPAGVLDEAALARAGLGGAAAAAPAAPAPVVPERGALSRAANLAAASAPPATAPLTEAVRAQGEPGPVAQDAETGEITPEVRTAQIEERLDFLAQMGRMQGWSPEAVAQRSALQQELDLLSPAQRMDDLQAQADAAEARAADWAGREYRPNPTELPVHAAQGGPVDIQEANEQRRLKSMQQAQQEAAEARDLAQQLENDGNAQAQLAALEDRQERQEPAGRAEMPSASTMVDSAGAPAAAQAAPVPEAAAPAAPDILNRLGKPFTVKLAANKAAKDAGAGWEPVKVEGGFVVRQVQPSTSTSTAAPATPPVQQAATQGDEGGSAPSAQDQVPAAPQEPGARWDGMAPEAQRAVLAAAPNLVPVLRKNLEGKAWEKISDGNRSKLSAAMEAQPQPAPAPAPAPAFAQAAAPATVEGKDLGNGWAAFTPESGTKGVPRAVMPQIKAEHRGAMVNFMNARGIAHQEETVPAASLKPTQAEFDRAKVQKAIGFPGGDRSILVSQDGHVLDGHHQWLAARDQGKDVKTIRLDAPIEQLLETARAFPSSTTSAGAAPGPDIQAASSLPAQASATLPGQDPAPASAAPPATAEKPKPAGPTNGPAFKKWFGESKAVSDEGSPLVMYHGTSASEDGQAFGIFDTYASNYGLMGMGGYFTADAAVASSYTSKGKGSTPTVYPVYLSIKNPLDMDAKADPEVWQKQFPDAANFHEGGDTNESWFRAAEEALSEEGLPKWEGAEAMQDGLRGMGFDGITHIGGGRVKSDGVRHRVFIAFDPEQIKSATGNSGDFDPSNPNIAREDGKNYRAEARRRGYDNGQIDLFEQTDAGKQIDLWLDGEPDPSQAGPRGATARSAAAAAVADLYATETILGLALSRDYAARQRVNFVGQEVTSAADLAVLAQVYRDPRFETFRLVFVNDAGKVVSQVGLSSRLPAAATAIIGNDIDGYLREVSEAARSTGASGFYMLHNHPSGVSAASNADRGLTAAFAARMPILEFKDHVVIDTNEYTTIDRRGMVQTHHKDFGQPAPMTYGEWGGRQISGPADIMSMAKQMAVDEKAVTLITLDNQLRVKGVTELAAGAVGYDRAANRRAVLKATMRQQGARVVAVGRDMDVLRRLEGSVLDAVMVMDVGEPRSLAERGILQGADLFPQDRRTRVTGDSSKVFDYLRSQSAPKTNPYESESRVAEPDPAGDSGKSPQSKYRSTAAAFRRVDNEGDAAAAAAPGMTPEQAEQLLRIMGQAPQQSRGAQDQAVTTVRAMVDAIRAGWANGPEVIVVHDMSDKAIPAAARRADQAQRSGGAEGNPEGFYYDGKVYLLASQLPTQQDAARVLMHEALGHHGLRGVFGKDLDSVLQQIVAVRRGDVRSKAAEYGLDYENPGQRLQAAEEVLAEWAQTRPEMGFVRRAVAAIRTWLRQHVPGLKRLAVTDAEIIRSYILPARGWVERGAGASGTAQAVPAYSRSDKGGAMIPDAMIGSTLGSASSHPDYAAAKAGDVEAAVRLAQHMVTPELLEKVRAVIGNTKPRVVPVAAEEASGRNKIPRAAAEVLAMRLGLETAGGIVQANRARRTGLDGLDRIFAPVDFAGAVEHGPYLLVDDTLTQGGTFAALASHIREGGGTVAGVIALTGKQYSATIQPSAETLSALRQKHGDLENEFRAATGYGFDALTQSEARYLARYEPADRLRDRILDEGRRGRQREDEGNPGPGPVSGDGPAFSRAQLATLKNSALDQLGQALSHEGKVSLWDKTVGTMRHLAERSPVFRPVYESAQRNIDDVSMLANDAADRAPRILPRVESMGDIFGKDRKRPVSAEDNKAVARPLFEGTLVYGRDVDGKPALVDDLAKKYANMAVYNKAALLLRTKKLDPSVLTMWQGLPVQQYEKLIESRFESKILKAGVVWSDEELKQMFSASPNQISLYREARAAVDRSIDLTARTDMLRTLGDEYAGLRDIVLDQADLAGAAQLLLDTLEQDAKAVPDNRDRISDLMQQVRRRLDTATDLQQAGYAPLSRFGQYTVDVVDAAGERKYFGMYETMRESNMAVRNFRQTFPGATVTQGTMSQQTFKLFAGVSPETLEHFGEMLGLRSQGNDAQDKAFQAYLQLTKNNHSALKRLIHRKGTAGYSTDVGRVVANFVYSNARAGALGMNAGTLDKAIQSIPQQQGEIRDLAMGLRSYIQDPQEEGQAVRGMLFAQYLGGSLASAFVNMTQPFQVTLPWLSQHGGMKKAGAQLARALKDMGTKGFQYETELAKALKSAEDDGVVSPQEIHQLMAQSRGAGGLRAGDGTAAGNARAAAGNAWERTKVAWGQPFALAEQFNRRSTFIASYRLAKQQGIQNPAAFARHAVLETQFVYSKANKPQWARGTIGGTLFTFKTYSVSYLELMQRMWTQGGPEGKRAVGWSMAMLMLMSGAGGLPFVEDVEDLIDAGGQLMGYSMAVKQWRKQLMQDVVGKELADFIEQGLSGLPGAPVDVSGRLGMGNLIPGTGMLLEKRDHSRDLLEVLGPAGDLIKRAATGARKALAGDVAGGALEVSPTAVRNFAKGVDMANSGVYKDTKGRKVIDVTLAEAAAKAIGFQPKTVAEVQEATGTEQNLISQNRAMRERLSADLAQAIYDRDAEKQQVIRDRARAWNLRNPESPLTIDMQGVRRRVAKMRQTKAERVAAAAPKSIRASVRQSLGEAQAAATAP